MPRSSLTCRRWTMPRWIGMAGLPELAPAVRRPAMPRQHRRVCGTFTCSTCTALPPTQRIAAPRPASARLEASGCAVWRRPAHVTRGTAPLTSGDGASRRWFWISARRFVSAGGILLAPPPKRSAAPRGSKRIRLADAASTEPTAEAVTLYADDLTPFLRARLLIVTDCWSPHHCWVRLAQGARQVDHDMGRLT